MADQLPVNFQIPAEGAVSSYTWTEIGSGTGYITYYPGTIAGNYILSNNPFYPDQQVYKVTEQVSDTANFDKDYDVLINRPLTVQGKMIVTMPFLKSNVGTQGHIYVYLRKWDGANETEVVSAEGTSFTSLPASTPTNLGAIITVPTTRFKKGEYLRVTIQIHVTGGVAGGNLYMGVDPMNMDDPTAGEDALNTFMTQTIVQIPVRIEL